MSEPVWLFKDGDNQVVYAPSVARKLEADGWSRTPPAPPDQPGGVDEVQLPADDGDDDDEEFVGVEVAALDDDDEDEIEDAPAKAGPKRRIKRS